MRWLGDARRRLRLGWSVLTFPAVGLDEVEEFTDSAYKFWTALPPEPPPEPKPVIVKATLVGVQERPGLVIDDPIARQECSKGLHIWRFDWNQGGDELDRTWYGWCVNCEADFTDWDMFRNVG